MSHIAFQPAGAPIECDADYVVVGSGAGGASAAVHLARAGERVAIVEAGPWRAPSDYPSSMYGALRDMIDDWGSLITRGRALWPVVQARVVGGTTVINSAIVVRTPGDIFEHWKKDYGVGGKAMADAIWTYQDQLEDELFVQPVPAAARGQSNRLAQEGAEALGLHDHDMVRNVKDCEGHGQCLQGCRAERKQSTNLNFVPEVIQLGGAVVSCAPVQRVVFEGNRAVGVTGRFRHPATRKKGAVFTVRAKKGVIVAASATHSPALLLRSGVKMPAMGYYFRSHPGTGVFGLYDQRVDPNAGATQGWSTTSMRESLGIKLETLSLPLELVCGRLSGAGSQLMERLADYSHLAMWCVACRAEAVGRVSTGFGGGPVVRYTLTKADMARLRQACYTLAQMHLAAGAKAIIPGVHGLPYRLEPDQIDKIKEASLDPRYWVGILSHLFGGCVMGADPKRSVCDGNGQVYGYEGLTVADASAIPSTLGVNPQHTIMALARYYAQHLLDG